MPLIDRRSLLSAAGSGAAAIAAPGWAAHAAGLHATDLRTAGQRDPLAVGDMQPMLSWQVNGPAGTMQTAYQVRVASAPDKLADGAADLWDSKRVADGTSTGIRYAGSPLAARQRCWWQVRIWDATNNASPWSAPARWEAALRMESDWHGEWLAVESLEERADRETQPRWVQVEQAGGSQPARFRLPFSSSSGAGLLTIATRSSVTGLTVDGTPLALRHQRYAGYGGPPAERIAIDLTAGAHVLTVDVAAGKEGQKHVAALAAQLRLPVADGMRRIAGGWQIADPQGVWQPAAIAPGDAPFPWPPSPARLLRRRFRLNAITPGMRLHVAALGGYRVWINGARVGDDELQCEPSEYRRHVPYRTYDVTSMLQSGDNVVGVMVADGFYASYQAPDGRYAFGPAPRRLRLTIEHADGRPCAVTDAEWRHHPAPITLSEIYAGEDQDLRRWPLGWAAPGFDDAGWEPVWQAPAPEGALVAPLAPPIRITRMLRPQTIRRLGPRAHLIDFGQNFGGRVRLSVRGEAGREVVVRHAEVLTADGLPDRRNLREARAEDHYLLSGAGLETLEPVFTFQGFRYAQVDGLDTLDTAQVTGLVVSSDLGEIGTFRTSQPLVQKLWLNTLWSQRSNFRGIPTDCPQRDERLGWTGDAQIFWETAAFNMDVRGFTRAFTHTLRDDQAANGAYPMWSPSPKGLGWGSDSATPGWADAGVMLPYMACLHGGDRSVVDDNWTAMTAYCEGILRANPDGLWRHGRGADLGDWLALDAKWPGDETTPKPLIATAMLARSLDQMVAMAGWTGRDPAAWQARAARTRRAFVQAFVRSDGAVGNGSQTGYVLALRLGLVPEALRAAIGARLAADIVRRGRLLSTGFLGTPLALDALADTGHGALAFDLLLRTDYPSWGYMAQRGATTMWERWNGDVGDVSMNSYNHYAFGSVCAFLYRRVAGLAPLEPGFRRFRVAPLFDPRVDAASVTLDSASGRITFDWRREAGALVMNLQVPANTEAELVLPRVNKMLRSGPHHLRTFEEPHP